MDEAPILAPQRIQLSRAKGWRMPPNTISVARPGRWGNPYQVSVFGRERAIKLFEDTITGYWSPGNFTQAERDAAPYSLIDKAHDIHRALQKRIPSTLHFYIVRELGGRNLACWCKPGEACHADVLLRLANPEVPR